MSATLDQLIEWLQAVRDETAEAQKRVDHVKRVISVQEYQLQKTRKQIAEEESKLDACKQKVEALTSKSTGKAADQETTSYEDYTVSTSRGSRRKSRKASPDRHQDEQLENDPEYDEHKVPSAGHTSYPAIIHHRFPTIIRYAGDWTEISCHLCGMNSSPNGGFFKGANGLKRHYFSTHTISNATKLNHVEVLSVCTKRVVSDRDAAKMIKAQSPVDHAVEKISMPLNGIDAEASADIHESSVARDPDTVRRTASAGEDVSTQQTFVEKSKAKQMRGLETTPKHSPPKTFIESKRAKDPEPGDFDADRATIAGFLKEPSTVDSYLAGSITQHKRRHSTYHEFAAIDTSHRSPAKKRRRTIHFPDHPTNLEDIPSAAGEEDEGDN